MPDYYYHLSSKFESLDNIRNFLATTPDWPSNPLRTCSLDIPPELIIDQSIILLSNTFKTRAQLIRFNNNSTYGWHKDVYRNAVINVEIKTNHSKTYYGQMVDETLLGTTRTIDYKNLDVVKYREGYMTLLNA